MPETLEAPPDTTKPPQVPKVKSGDPVLGDLGAKFDQEFKKLTVAEPDADRDTKKPEPPKPTEPEPEKEETPSNTEEKPSSALEAALGEDTKPPETQPGLAELDKIEAELDQVTTPKSEDWKRAREARKLLRDELTKAQSAPKPVDANVEVITKENADLKEQLGKLKTDLKAINGEYSEEFQGLIAEKEKFIGKIANKMKYAGEVGKENVDDLVAALQLPESKFKTAAIKQAMADLDPDDKISVRALIERVDEADEKIAEFKKDLPGQFEKLQEQKKLSAKEQADKESKLQEVEFRKILDDLPKEVVLLRRIPDDVTGAKEWNDRIDRVTSSALNVLRPNGADFKKTVEIDVKGHLFDDVWKDLLAEKKENKEMRARLREFDSGGPDFKGGKPPSGKIERKVTATSEDYERAYQQSLNAANSAGVGP